MCARSSSKGDTVAPFLPCNRCCCARGVEGAKADCILLHYMFEFCLAELFRSSSLRISSHPVLVPVLIYETTFIVVAV